MHGPYRAPPLRRGDRAVCLCRDAEVRITSWSDGRIPWPRCRRADQKAGGERNRAGLREGGGFSFASAPRRG